MPQFVAVAVVTVVAGRHCCDGGPCGRSGGELLNSGAFGHAY